MTHSQWHLFQELTHLHSTHLEVLMKLSKEVLTKWCLKGAPKTPCTVPPLEQEAQSRLSWCRSHDHKGSNALRNAKRRPHPAAGLGVVATHKDVGRQDLSPAAQRWREICATPLGLGTIKPCSAAGQALNRAEEQGQRDVSQGGPVAFPQA